MFAYSLRWAETSGGYLSWNRKFLPRAGDERVWQRTLPGRNTKHPLERGPVIDLAALLPPVALSAGNHPIFAPAPHTLS